jgi:hypothetical protein
VASAEERDGRERRCQPLGQARGVGRAQPFVPQVHDAAAALAEAGPERVALHGLWRVPHGRRLRQLRAGLLDRLELQLAAADGADELIGEHQHPGAGLARGRAFGGLDAHQHGILAPELCNDVGELNLHHLVRPVGKVCSPAFNDRSAWMSARTQEEK